MNNDVASETSPIIDLPTDAIKKIGLFLETIFSTGRYSLYEYEVYRLLSYAGLPTVPKTHIITNSSDRVTQELNAFPGNKVVLKIISRTILHKTEVGGVKIITNQEDGIWLTAMQMMQEVPKNYRTYLNENPEAKPKEYQELDNDEILNAIKKDIYGVLVAEFIPKESTTFGNELLVGIRKSREFGMVITAGLGGVNTELFAANFQKGQAVVSASTKLTNGADFFKLFQTSVAYKVLSGMTRGGSRIISDKQLISCFKTLIAIANQFSPANPNAPYILEELEINPFAILHNQLVPLDGICHFSKATTGLLPRPIKKIANLLHPTSIGIIGVSAKKMNFGRIILGNLLESGFDKSKVFILRPGESEIDGVKCVTNLQALEHKLDLFIVAVGADAVFNLVDEIIETDAAESVILIPGGLGETEASKEQSLLMSSKIDRSHASSNGGPIFLGGNCLGVVSHPGSYDSWFISKQNLPREQKKQQRNTALISQSGAFMISRLSQNPWLDPAYMVALGNQNDLTHSDMLNYFSEHPDIEVIGIYAEGFNDLDGLAFAKAVRTAVRQGKQVIFYKAGQSAAGVTAAMSHTASIAGDYTVCEAIISQAGAIVANNLSEFNELFYIADLLHNKKIGGNRVAAISGAGFEAVGMADSIEIDTFSLSMANIEERTHIRLKQILAAKKLDLLMEIHNPFDINPGADDEVHTQCAAAFAEDPNVDAILIGLDPLSPMMRSLKNNAREGFDINSPDSIVQKLPTLISSQSKPIIGIVDGGALYDPMVEKLKDQNVCIFRSCDRAGKALAKYMNGRLNAELIRGQSKINYP